jgi:hypothetical protein
MGNSIVEITISVCSSLSTEIYLTSETLKTGCIIPSRLNIRRMGNTSSRCSEKFLATVAKSYENSVNLVSSPVLICIA